MSFLSSSSVDCDSDDSYLPRDSSVRQAEVAPANHVPWLVALAALAFLHHKCWFFFVGYVLVRIVVPWAWSLDAMRFVKDRTVRLLTEFENVVSFLRRVGQFMARHWFLVSIWTNMNRLASMAVTQVAALINICSPHLRTIFVHVTSFSQRVATQVGTMMTRFWAWSAPARNCIHKLILVSDAWMDRCTTRFRPVLKACETWIEARMVAFFRCLVMCSRWLWTSRVFVALRHVLVWATKTVWYGFEWATRPAFVDSNSTDVIYRVGLTDYWLRTKHRIPGGVLNTHRKRSKEEQEGAAETNEVKQCATLSVGGCGVRPIGFVVSSWSLRPANCHVTYQTIDRDNKSAPQTFSIRVPPGESVLIKSNSETGQPLLAPLSVDFVFRVLESDNEQEEAMERNETKDEAKQETADTPSASSNVVYASVRFFSLLLRQW